MAFEVVPNTNPTHPAGLPNPDSGLTLAGRSRTSEEIARQIKDAHVKGRSDKRMRDLTGELYAMKIDGEGDGQWATIQNGSRVSVPVNLSGGLRLQWNLLRPIVANFIAYQTALPFRVMADAPAGRDAQDRALLDTIYANHVLHTQRANRKVAEALAVGVAYGHGIVHAMWRDDLSADFYEPLYNTDQPQLGQALRKGFVDLFCGDPWDTVYSSGSTRDSVYSYTYGRSLPADLVRQAFPHIQGLEGRSDLPSSSRFQRIARKWLLGNNAHASSVVQGHSGAQETIALICREILPGIDPQYPDGALHIIALSGASDTDDSGRSGSGRPVLLHDGPLPGGRPSGTRFYTDLRLDDVHGKPFVADLVDLQDQLNQYVTEQAEWARRFTRPPLFINGEYELDSDSSVYDDDVVIQTHMQGAQAQFLYPPTAANSPFKWLIESTMERMWQIGAYQAASRGEKSSGDPAAALVFMSKADDTILGPANRAIQDSICEMCQTAHALFRQYGDAPQLVTITGEEYQHLADGYLHAEQLSDTPPNYQVVSGFGSTLEARAQQILSLAQVQLPDGTVLLTGEEAKRLWPDKSLVSQGVDVVGIRKRRATVVNHAIREAAASFAQQVEQHNAQLQQLPPEWQQMAQAQTAEAMAAAPMKIEAEIFGRFPLEYTDDPQMWIDSLDELIQDTNEDPTVQQVARIRQNRYVERAMQVWQSQAGMGAPQEDPAMGGGSGPSEPFADPSGQQSLHSEVESLTAEASAA